MKMVRKLCDDGVSYYHEPPYTEEEEMDLYRRTGSVVSILHCPKTAAVPPAQPDGDLYLIMSEVHALVERTLPSDEMGDIK
jgi:hypothetical protein